MAGFHDIIGHDMVKDHLQKAIEYHKVSHAYILSGEEGDGKKDDRQGICHDTALRKK